MIELLLGVHPFIVAATTGAAYREQRGQKEGSFPQQLVRRRVLLGVAGYHCKSCSREVPHFRTRRRTCSFSQTPSVRSPRSSLSHLLRAAWSSPKAGRNPQLRRKRM